MTEALRGAEDEEPEALRLFLGRVVAFGRVVPELLDATAGVGLPEPAARREATGLLDFGGEEVRETDAVLDFFGAGSVEVDAGAGTSTEMRASDEALRLAPDLADAAGAAVLPPGGASP